MLDLANFFKRIDGLSGSTTVLAVALPGMTISSSRIITVPPAHKDHVQAAIAEIGQLWGNVLQDRKHPLHPLAQRHLKGITIAQLTTPAEATGHLIFTPACRSGIWQKDCLYLDGNCVTRLAHLHAALEEQKLLVNPDQLGPHICIAAFDRLFKLQATQITPRAQARELSLG